MMRQNIFRYALCLLLCLAAFGTVQSQSAIVQEPAVADDPYDAQIFTLPNGLKVYLSVYKDAPRIQCYIAVQAGSKNDPAECTGLAHYFEHLMFKGTSRIGTLDYAQEKPLLDSIENLFEIYRLTTDSAQRARLYQRIDSFSYAASRFAIPNEYTQIMKSIGAQGTNAWTSNDNTVFVENIPSNQLENWAKIQSERFTDPVIRLFHTELETVYEEKNMSLTRDSRTAREAAWAALLPNHPYGQQTTIGKSEHLRNPSITNIKKFFQTYYVPNNMAIVLAGDFEVKEALDIIDRYFGKMPYRDVPRLNAAPDPRIDTPLTREVTGLDKPFVDIVFRIDVPTDSKELDILYMFDLILCNGKSGLIDLNLNQKQRVLSATAAPYGFRDKTTYLLSGQPKNGQTLEEVKDLLLAQLDAIKEGDFDESLLQAAINNLKVDEMRRLESNSARASKMLSTFIMNHSWEDDCHKTERYTRITKQDIIDFAQRHFQNNYVVVYKRQGEPQNVTKVTKPHITPIIVNRDTISAFFQEIKASKTKEIQPVFIDYDKAITFAKIQKAPLYYVQNIENETFSLRLRFPVGEQHDLRLPIIAQYFNYLGTANHSAEAIKQKLYALACNLTFSCSDDYSQISLSGLTENFDTALALTLDLIQNAQPDETALKDLVINILQKKENAKKNQQTIFNVLRNYCEYGDDLVHYQLSKEDLEKLTAPELTQLLRSLLTYQPTIVYYGSMPLKHLKRSLGTHFRLPEKFAVAPQKHEFHLQEVTENQVFFVHFPAKQSRLSTYSRGPVFSTDLYPAIALYNRYFGGGMSAIVFQEMREKRSLAYTAYSSYVMPQKKGEYLYNYAFIATQNDKVEEAFTAFDTLFNDMPQSEKTFRLAQEGAKTAIATERITKERILSQYLANQRRGWNNNYRKEYYETLDRLTLADVVAFNRQYIQNQPHYYLILGNKDDIDTQKMEQRFGKVHILSKEDIFGY